MDSLTAGGPKCYFQWADVVLCRGKVRVASKDDWLVMRAEAQPQHVVAAKP